MSLQGDLFAIQAAYADGGMLGGSSRSPEGATFAWCHVRTPALVVADPLGWQLANGGGIYVPRVGAVEDGVVTFRRGECCQRRFFVPPYLDDASNNQAEYLALLECLEALPAGWSGPVYSDSQITLGRFFDAWNHKNIPEEWAHRRLAALNRLGSLSANLLDGHPTQAQLRAGIGKRGNRVSSFNQWCDSECNRFKALYWQDQQGTFQELALAAAGGPFWDGV